MLARSLSHADCQAIAAWDRIVAPPATPAAGSGLLHNLDLQAELQRPLTRGWVLVATDDAPIAYALVWHIVDELELVALATRPDFRRRGAGNALLAHVVAAARKLAVRRLTLEVGANNTAALALYRAAGFREFNRRPHYYAERGEDALEMELVL
jgi:[ribosomal protein S18]-alanine N-acetyltransferase